MIPLKSMAFRSTKVILNFLFILLNFVPSDLSYESCRWGMINLKKPLIKGCMPRAFVTNRLIIWPSRRIDLLSSCDDLKGSERMKVKHLWPCSDVFSFILSVCITFPPFFLTFLNFHRLSIPYSHLLPFITGHRVQVRNTCKMSRFVTLMRKFLLSRLNEIHSRIFPSQFSSHIPFFRF